MEMEYSHDVRWLFHPLPHSIHIVSQNQGVEALGNYLVIGSHLEVALGVLEDSRMSTVVQSC